MKSPVRENCTPGSVRGLSGNWQSYRDLTFSAVSFTFVNTVSTMSTCTNKGFIEFLYTW